MYYSFKPKKVYSRSTSFFRSFLWLHFIFELKMTVFINSKNQGLMKRRKLKRNPSLHLLPEVDARFERMEEPPFLSKVAFTCATFLDGFSCILRYSSAAVMSSSSSVRSAESRRHMKHTWSHLQWHTCINIYMHSSPNSVRGVSLAYRLFNIFVDMVDLSAMLCVWSSSNQLGICWE